MRAQHISWGQVFTLCSETLWFLSTASTVRIPHPCLFPIALPYHILTDHIHGQYFPLCTRWKDIDRKHQEDSNKLMKQWSIPEIDQVWIQPDKGWILRTSNWRRKNIYGPRKAKRNQGLINPYNSQANPRISRVWELLPTIHLAFLGAGWMIS